MGIFQKSSYCCTDSVQGFALFGMIIFYVAVYFVTALLIGQVILSIMGKKRYKDLTPNKKDAYILMLVFWPATIFVGLIYLIIMWIRLPFVAAEKRELREVEGRLTRMIVTNTPIESRQKTNFLVGDLITGVKGNPDNYKHLNEGCVCKVLSIDQRGRMVVSLVAHKNFKEHVNQIGKTFKAPSRNFVLYNEKKTIPKKKSSKKIKFKKR